LYSCRDHTHQLKAYIPVAPICTNKFTAEQYRDVQVPTLIVYGDQDTQLGEVSLKNLSNLPNHRVTWHKSILEFLKTLL
uniref:Uncharacterized protein n=1 Tax=Astyanax mexicanus TaxID=7994 RepID=A0A3B1JUS6_ASTMX